MKHTELPPRLNLSTNRDRPTTCQSRVRKLQTCSERASNEPGGGGARFITHVCREENQSSVIAVQLVAIEDAGSAVTTGPLVERPLQRVTHDLCLS